MQIIEVKDRMPSLTAQLLKVWEASVKATHLFLSEDEITAIKQYVPEALGAVPHLIVAKEEDETPVAFMGIVGQKLEMLFVAPEKRGQGVGKQLLRYGMEHYAVNELVVNEQNPAAKGFYEHLGFRVCQRAERDEQGNPYPILYMRL